MNTTTKALATTALAFGFATIFGATAAHAATTPQITAKHGVIYVNGTQVTGDEVNTQPALSPDTTQIAYLHNNTVWVMHLDGTAQHQVSDRTGNHPAWDGSGVRITYTATSCTGTQGTYRTGTNGGETNEVVAPAACVSQELPQAGYIMG